MRNISLEKLLLALSFVLLVAGVGMLMIATHFAEAVGMVLIIISCCTLLGMSLIEPKELAHLKRPKPIRFTFRLKGQGEYDGIWAGYLYYDPTTGGPPAPSPNPEERILSRVRLSEWTGGLRNTLLRAPHYGLDRENNRCGIRGCEFTFDEVNPPFEYAID